MAVPSVQRRRKTRNRTGLTGLVLAVLLLCAGRAAAQSDGLLVTITRVDSQAFPQVTAYVAASAEDGPVAGLGAADFQITEADQAVPPEAVTVEAEDNLDLRLVLALDTSMPADWLAATSAALAPLIEALGPRDRAGIIGFQDNAVVLHDLTNNTQELQTVVAGLQTGGSYSALHQAAIEAVAMASQASPGRTAVLIITDSRNNTGNITPAEVISQARAVSVPLWLVGLGDKAQPAQLQQLARPTGGMVITLPNPDQLPDTLAEIEDRLRQGYRVSFRSGLPADKQEHRLAIGLTYSNSSGRESSGQAVSGFVAVPGPVSVSLPGFVNGQTVKGIVMLAPQVTAPASLAAVEYVLDGQVLNRVTGPPFHFEWNSASVQPGRHQLAISVMDQAGNVGQAELALDVAYPLSVVVTSSHGEINKGDQVAISARIESLASIARVDFLLDGKLLSSATSPPYGFALDSGQFVAGTHELTVRVEDSLGQQAEDKLSLRFLPPPPSPPPGPGWLDYLGRAAVIGVAAILVLGLLMFGLALLRRMAFRQRQSCQRRCGVVVTNQGNIRSRYELWAEDPAGALRFEFRVDGMALPLYRTTEFVEAIAAEPAQAPMYELAGMAPETAQPVSNGRGKQQAVGQAMRTGSALSGMLGSVASLLPSSAARSSLRSVTGRVQQGQVAVRQVQQTSGQVSRVAGRVLPVQPGQAQAAPHPPAKNNPPAAAGRVPAAAVSRASVRSGAETPFVEPGRSLVVEVVIDPVKPFLAQVRTFSLGSRSIEQGQAPALVEEGRIDLPGLAWWRRYLPRLLVIFLALSLAAGIGYGVYYWFLTAVPG